MVSCTLITPLDSSLTMKASAVVAIGVDRPGIGRDNGVLWRLPALRSRRKNGSHNGNRKERRAEKVPEEEPEKVPA